MTLYSKIVKIAYEHPETRKELLPLLREHRARFEKGVPADPTQNMTQEDAEKWHDMNEKYRDKFKESARGKEGSRKFLRDVVDYSKWRKFLSDTQKEDAEVFKVLREVYEEMHQAFRLERNTEVAFNKLNNMILRGNYDPEMKREQVAQIADLLGINARHLFY